MTILEKLNFKVETVDNVKEEVELLEFIMNCCKFDLIHVNDGLELHKKLIETGKAKGFHS